MRKTVLYVGPEGFIMQGENYGYVNAFKRCLDSEISSESIISKMASVLGVTEDWLRVVRGEATEYRDGTDYLAIIAPGGRSRAASREERRAYSEIGMNLERGALYPVGAQQ